MHSLVDDALVIMVHIELIGPVATPPFVPKNPSRNIIQDIFMDEESADIVFEVGGQQFNNESTNEFKTLPVRFPAHRLVLRKCSSSILSEMCGSVGDKTSPILIPDVSPVVFEHLLFHLYGGKVDDYDMKSHAKDITLMQLTDMASLI